MTFKRVRIKETVYVNTGGTPGSSSTSDSIGLYARVVLADTITTAATDTVGFYARVTLPDTVAAQSDTANLYAKVNLADTAPAQADLLSRLGVTGYDANTAPDDALMDVDIVIQDANAAPGDLIRAGFAGAGLSDVTAAPGDARSASVRVWGASQTSTGSGATNGANALGQNDGIFATVQGATGLGANTATLTVTIPVASIPVSTSGTYILRMYATGTFGLLTTLNATYVNTGGTPASGTITSGAAVTAPSTDVTLTKLGTAVTVTFTSTGATLAGSSWQVDAVCVVSAPTF